MLIPSDLSADCKNVLTEYGFELVDSSDNGILKSYIWANRNMQFALIYDRNYYECDIIPQKKPINPLSLIRLLRFLKNDKTFYKEELIKADLAYTLAPDKYVDLLDRNYNLILEFLSDFSQEKYSDYNSFEYKFEGL